MQPNLFNARAELREIIARQREDRRPFNAIQCFGLPLNEFVASPAFRKIPQEDQHQ